MPAKSFFFSTLLRLYGSLRIACPSSRAKHDRQPNDVNWHVQTYWICSVQRETQIRVAHKKCDTVKADNDIFFIRNYRCIRFWSANTIKLYGNCNIVSIVVYRHYFVCKKSMFRLGAFIPTHHLPKRYYPSQMSLLNEFEK